MEDSSNLKLRNSEHIVEFTFVGAVVCTGNEPGTRCYITKTWYNKSKTVASTTHMVMKFHIAPGNVYGTLEYTRMKLLSGLGWVTLQDLGKRADGTQFSLTQDEIDYALQPFPIYFDCNPCNYIFRCPYHDALNVDQFYVNTLEGDIGVYQRKSLAWDDLRVVHLRKNFKRVGSFPKGAIVELDTTSLLVNDPNPEYPSIVYMKLKKTQAWLRLYLDGIHDGRIHMCVEVFVMLLD